MQCGKCSSDNTQLLQMAYEGGTQDIQTKSKTTGIGIAKGGLGIGRASTSTSGTSQSLLATRVAPPKKRTYLYSLITGFLAWIILSATTVSSMWFYISIAVMALCCYLIYSAFMFNKNVWPGQFKHWQKGWVCLKCGHIYYIE
jgi:hypothetical protein